MGLATMRFTRRTVAALTAISLLAALAAVPFSLDFYRANEIIPPHVPDGATAWLLLVHLRLVPTEDPGWIMWISGRLCTSSFSSV